MKHTHIHSLILKFIFTVIVSATLISCDTTADDKVSDDGGIPALVEREGALADTDEWQKTQAKVDELRKKAIENPDDNKIRLQIATIYMSEARITGNSYYHQAALKILDDILAKDPKSFEAYTFKSSIAMSLHQFEEAKKLAEKARSINPANAYVYGVLVDANVELGNYEEAIAMSDTMQQLKPSLESYARASYLREIHGDYPGAIEAMQMAVKAGATGTESAEWARVTLADIYLQNGNLDTAEMLYNSSLEVRPVYPEAEIGLAKIARIRGDYDKAIKHTENAIRTVSDVSYVAFLGETYAMKGDKEKADEVNNDVVDLLEEADEEQENNIIQHNSNRELAMAYMHVGKYDKALEYAKNDLKLRPDNIDANELVAWIYYLKGDYKSAKSYADKMLATKSTNAEKLYKAGMIYSKAGDKEKGTKYIQDAKKGNAHIEKNYFIASAK